MILEGIVTTLNEDGEVNISPMGPIVDQAMQEMVLRPYQTSTTYQNLKRTKGGVFHVTDNVDMLARAAVNELEPPQLLPAPGMDGWIIADACRWYALEVVDLDDSRERTTIYCRTAASGRHRDFFGFNRAKHAVIEAAILATRLDFLPEDQIRGEFERLAVLVDKTAGEQERRAFDFLSQYVQAAWAEPAGDEFQWWEYE